jgi:hypothetical protein
LSKKVDKNEVKSKFKYAILNIINKVLSYKREKGKLKRIILIGIFTIFFVLLTGCVAAFGPLMDEDILIYETEDKTIRLEIPYFTNFGLGRLYIEQDGVVSAYTIDMDMVQPFLIIYTTPRRDDYKYVLNVSFGKINYFKSDYDIMYLTERSLAEDGLDTGYDEKLQNLLTGFNVTLHRVYDEDVQPLNHFYNTWQSEDYNIYLTNDTFEDYYYHRINGEFNEESIMITFEDAEFTITNTVDNTIELSGTYDFDGLSIILDPVPVYENYPNTITLIFVIDPNE